MKRSAGRWVMAILAAVLITGCGEKEKKETQQATSTLSGVASKGPIDNGTVKVYALNANGSTGSLLGTASTGTEGSYSVNIGTYSGSVLVEVTGGTYTDEATGTTGVSNPGLKAAVADVSGTVTVAVTPLTDIAVQYAGTSLTAEKIEQANYLVSTLAGVNIIDTLPVNVTDSMASSNASMDQINYGLMLAAISQMVENGDALDVTTAITNIKDDLADGTLNTTSTALLTALTDFVADPAVNNSGVTTLDQTNLDSAINYVATNTVDPTLITNVSDLTKAKSLVSDMRNTVLSIYNYQGVGVPGIVETPFYNLSEELQTKIEPELTTTVDRIGWIVESANYVAPGTTQVFGNLSYPTYKLEITVSSDETSGSFTVKDGDTPVDSGSLTLTANADGLPTSGTFSATMKSASGNLTANLNYSGTFNSSGSPTNRTFTGSMAFPGFSLDFSQSGRKMYATFAQEPGSTDPGDIYPTSILLSARITTTTAQMDGNLNISSIVWASKGDYYNNPVVDCFGQMRPKSGTFTGSFAEMKDGATTGVKFSGTMTGAYTNAATYDGCAYNNTSTNYPQWNASFDGKIEAPSRPTTTAFLKATQSGYRTVSLDANYKRTNTDSTVVSLSGSGTVQTAEDTDFATTGHTHNVLTASLTNQDGMKVNISNDDSKTGDNQFTGTITTSGSEKMADLYTIDDAPMVKYSDNYFESIF